MRSRSRLLPVASHPLVDYAIKVALHRDHFSLPRSVESPLRVVVLTAIVCCPPPRVAQNLVGAIDLHEPGAGVGRSRNVRMVFAREATVGRLDFTGRCARSQSENPVEVRHNVKLLIKVGARNSQQYITTSSRRAQ